MRYLIPGIVAAAVFWALLHIRKKARRGGGCCGEHEEAEKRRRVSDRNPFHYPYSVELKIGGMTCENCARRVENALNAMDGVWAKADISAHKAAVRLKQPPDEATLSRAVAGAGYVVLGMISDDPQIKPSEIKRTDGNRHHTTR